MGTVALGATASAGVPEVTMLKIINGDMAAQLQSARTENYEQLTQIEAARRAARTSQAQALVQKASAANLAARNAINEAITKYSTLVGWIQTFAGKAYSPPQLSGMDEFGVLGILGIDDAAEAIALLVAAGVAVTATLYALSYLWNTITGKTQETRGYLAQLGDVVQAGGGLIHETSGLINTAAIAAAVGVVAYFGFQWLKNRRAA